MMNIYRKFKIHNLTLLLLLSAFLSGYIKYALIILFIVIFHEMGHIIASIFLGYKIKEVMIYPFGGLTKIDKHLNDHIYKDLLIALSGVLMQFILFLLCHFNIINNPFLAKYNLSIMLFNLMPIIPLDGSKIVFEVSNYFFSYQNALKVYTIISIISIIIYFLLNYHYQLNNYLIISLFLVKTYEIIKNKRLIYHKFILERRLYDLDFAKIKNQNQALNNYHKDTKYYYHKKGKVIQEKDYLNSLYE